MLKLFLIGLCCLIFSVQAKLYQVLALTRHAARYHSMSFYDGNDTKPRWYQLTAVGMRQQQKFGQMIRKQYINNLNFLSSTYKPSQIQVYSTQTNRTITSAQAFFYGLYPPGTGPRITFVDRYLRIPPYSNKSDIEQQNHPLPNAHQPIKIRLNQKVMLTDCPNYMVNEQKNFGLSADVVNEMNRMSTLFNYTLKQTAKDNFLQLTRVYDAASVDNYLGRPLPSAFTEQDYQNTLHFTNWYYLIGMSNNNSFMANTFKVQKLINVFDLRTKLPDSLALKWTHLFGHDTDVIAFHLALNTSSPACIEELYRKGQTKAYACETNAVLYASNIIIQLHSDNAKDFYVKVRSGGKYVRLCSKGEYQCSYLEFKTLIKKSVSPISMDEICGKVIKQKNFEVVHIYRQEDRKIKNNIQII